jgi:DNA-binding transcriptional MerR regulator
MKLLRKKEAADLIGVKIHSLAQLERLGLLHPIRDWSKHRRFREDEVLSFREKLLKGETSMESES